ncbi:MAG: hypothetical protein ACI9IA_001489 [Enterobacterales bacterium]
MAKQNQSHELTLELKKMVSQGGGVELVLEKRLMNTLLKIENKDKHDQEKEEHCIEHLAPVSRGGTNDYSNLAGCCSLCNKTKTIVS